LTKSASHIYLQASKRYAWQATRKASEAHLQCESKKIPPYGFLNFFPNGWEFLINFVHTYYANISTLDYKFLFKYLQL